MISSVALMARQGRLEQTTGPVIDLTPDERVEFYRLRKASGLTQQQLGAKIGVSAGTISNIETGRSGQPRRGPYLEALRYLKAPKTDADNPDRTARFKRVMHKYMMLDERGEATVEATIDSQLHSLKNTQ